MYVAAVPQEAAAHGGGALMAWLRSRYRINARNCLAIMDAAADLFMTLRLAWEVGEQESCTIDRLSRELRQCRLEERTFRLPKDARGWFSLDYAYPDTGYVVAMMYLWAIDATEGRNREPSCRSEVMLWYLAKSVPPHSRRAVEEIGKAVSRFHDHERLEVC